MVWVALLPTVVETATPAGLSESSRSPVALTLFEMVCCHPTGASIEITKDGPYVAIAASGENIPIAMVKQVWPITLVPPARRWVADNIMAGLIEDFTYSAAIRPPAFNHRDPDAGWSGDDMLMDATFSGGAVTPFGDLPQVHRTSDR